MVSAPRAELPLSFDSHFHLDRSLALLRMDRHGTDFNSLCHVSPVSRDRNVKVVGAVANFCDPQTYPSPKEVDGLRRQGVRTTVGLYPKAAGNVSPSELRALQELLKVPGVVGLGVVGLDHSVSPKLLSAILPMATPQLVLVLHCRGMDRAGKHSGLPVPAASG